MIWLFITASSVAVYGSADEVRTIETEMVWKTSTSRSYWRLTTLRMRLMRLAALVVPPQMV